MTTSFQNNPFTKQAWQQVVHDHLATKSKNGDNEYQLEAIVGTYNKYLKVLHDQQELDHQTATATAAAAAAAAACTAAMTSTPVASPAPITLSKVSKVT
jgi:hypothetical protein